MYYYFSVIYEVKELRKKLTKIHYLPVQLRSNYLMTKVGYYHEGSAWFILGNRLEVQLKAYLPLNLAFLNLN